MRELQLTLLALICLSIQVFSQNDSLSGGLNHTVMLTPAGLVYAWGDNFYGQLGVDENLESYTQLSSNTPLLVNGLPHITEVDAGKDRHSLARTCSGTVYAWGLNGFGQLGNVDAPVAYGRNVGTPFLVQAGETNPNSPENPLEEVLEIAAGGQHSLALVGNLNVVCWGLGIGGVLGNGLDENSTLPVYVRDGYNGGILSNIHHIAAAQNCSYALTMDRNVYSWGLVDEQNGTPLGRPHDFTNIAMPVVMENGDLLSNIIAIAAGDGHCLALDWNGNVWAWGSDNGAGQIGDGPGEFTGTYATKVVAGESSGSTSFLGDASPVRAIAAGANHSVALTADGRVYTWGSNMLPYVVNTHLAGQLGVGPMQTSGDNHNGSNSSPMLALTGSSEPLSNIVSISAGDASTFAKAEDGTLYVCGFNEKGELGAPSIILDYFTPLPELDIITTLPGQLALGDDLETCEGFSHTLSAGVVNNMFLARFFKDGYLIHEEEGTGNEISVEVNEFGAYRVELLDHRYEHQPACDDLPIQADEITISLDEVGCETCITSVFERLVVANGEDTILCVGESVVLEPEVATGNIYGYLGFAYYRAAILDTATENMVKIDSIDITNANYVVNFEEAGTYTLVMFDYSDRENYTCHVAHQIEIVASPPPTVELSLSIPEDCGTPQFVQIECQGNSPFELRLVDEMNRTFNLLIEDESLFTIDELSLQAGIHELSITALSDRFCPSQIVPRSFTYEIESDELPYFSEDTIVWCNIRDDINLFSYIGGMNTSSIVSFSTDATSGSLDPIYGSFYPSVSGSGTFTIYLQSSNNSGCESADELIVQVVEEQIYYIQDFVLCGNADPISLNGDLPIDPSVSNESWTLQPPVANLSNGMLNPRDMSAGNYTLTYEYTLLDVCDYSVSTGLEIIRAEAPDVSMVSINYQRIPIDLTAMVATGSPGANFYWYYEGELVFADESVASGVSEYVSQEALNYFNPNDVPEAITFVYEVIQQGFDCVSDPREVATIVHVCPTPSPQVENLSICAGDEIPTFTAYGVGDGNIVWMDEAYTVLFESDDDVTVSEYLPTVGSSVESIYYYFVREFNSEFNCYSPVASVSLNIMSVPELSLGIDAGEVTDTNQTIQFQPSPTGGVLNGGEFLIYNAPIAELNLAMIHTDTVIAITYSYSNGQCADSVSQSVSIVQPSQRDWTVQNSRNVSSRELLNPFIIEGEVAGEIRWYDDQMNPIVLANGLLVFNPSSLIPRDENGYMEGEYAFFVSVTIDGVESEKVEAICEVYDCPASRPQAEDGIYCFGSDLPYHIQAIPSLGNEVHWYNVMSDIATGVPIAIGSQLEINTHTDIGTYHYYAVEYSSSENCESPAVEVSLNILELPSLEINIEDTLCYEAGARRYVEVVPYGGTLSGTDNSVFEDYFNLDAAEQTRTYTLTYEYLSNSGCEARIEKDVTVVYVPAPLTPNESPFFLIQETDLSLPAPEIYVENVQEGACVHWMDNLGLPLSDTDCNEFYQPMDRNEGTYSYWASQEVAGCVSQAKEVFLQIAHCPIGLTFVYPNSIDLCIGDIVPQISAEFNPLNNLFDFDGDEVIYWYADSSVTSIFIATGASFTPSINTNSSGNYTYYVNTYDPDLDCYGPFEEVQVNVGEAEIPTIIIDKSVCEGFDNRVWIKADAPEGSVITWRVNGHSDTEIGDSIEITTIGLEPGSLRIEAYTSFGTCISEEATDTLYIRESPDIIVSIEREFPNNPMPQVICQGNETIYYTVENRSEYQEEALVYEVGQVNGSIELPVQDNQHMERFSSSAVSSGSDTLIFIARNTYCSDIFYIPVYVLRNPSTRLFANRNEQQEVTFTHESESFGVVGLDIPELEFTLDYGDGTHEDLGEFLSPVAHQYNDGRYEAILTATNEWGCFSSSKVTITPDGITGVTEINSSLSVNVFTVDGKHLFSDVEVQTLSEHLSAGVYLLQQIQESGVVYEVVYIE